MLWAAGRMWKDNEIFVAFHFEGLGDEPSPSPTPSAPSQSASLTHSASWECLSTLPTNGSPLRHVTHVRPRPPRRHRAVHLPPESVSKCLGGVTLSLNSGGQNKVSRCSLANMGCFFFFWFTGNIWAGPPFIQQIGPFLNSSHSMKVTGCKPNV